MNIKKVLPIMIAALILIYTPFAVFGANVGFETENVIQEEKSKIISLPRIKCI